ncbi:MAG: hypothetical protein GC202_08535 [Alphaproteobacteria bacterium]|nr:hypothetical protein [Alphaproteobacteria bacterium]
MTFRIRLLVALGGVLWLAFASLALRGADTLFAMPIAEDGWYALTVARNMARGLGITIDGATWTNGFQPLFTFLEAGAFSLAGGSEEGGLRLVFALAALVHGMGALLAAGLARAALEGEAGTRNLAGALAFAGYLAAPKAFNDFYNGLETVLQATLYLAAWRFHATGWRTRMASRIGMGAILGALVLARIDAAVFVAVFCAAELWRGRTRIGEAVRVCVAVGATAVLVSSPWWLYNAIVFGHPMPISGFAQQAFAVTGERTEAAAWAIVAEAVPWIFAGAFENSWTAILRLAALAAFAAMVVFLRRAGKLPRPDREQAAFAAVLLVAYAALVSYYWVEFFAYWFYVRYFAPLSLLAFVYVPALAARVVPRAAFAAVMACAALAAVLLAFAWRGEGIFGHSSNDIQVALVEKYVPADATVAAGQSGTLGFKRAHVVNVDGKVNAEALKWRGRMWEYLDARGIEWFVDSTWYVELYLGEDPAAHGWSKTAQDDDWVVYRRVR